MEIKKAIELVMEKFPGRIPIGYWVSEDKVVVQTKLVHSMSNMTTPALFAVTSSGEVYGTIPNRENIKPDELVKI